MATNKEANSPINTGGDLGALSNGSTAPIQPIVHGTASERRDDVQPIILSMEEWDKIGAVLTPPKSWFDEPDEPDDSV